MPKDKKSEKDKKKKDKKKEEDFGLEPTSRKKEGLHMIEVPGLIQEYFLVPIVGVSPLVMGKVPREAKPELLKSQFKGWGHPKGVTSPPKPTPLNIFAGSIHQVDNCIKPKTWNLEFPFVWWWAQHTKPVRFKITCRPGYPSIALKKAFVGAAQLMQDVNSYLVDKIVKVYCDMMPIEYSELIMAQVPTKNDNNTPILSYLPAFTEWWTTAVVGVLKGMMTLESLINLTDGAGSRMGWGTRRPEQGGDFGIFMADRSRKIKQISRDDVYKIYHDTRELAEYPEVKITNPKTIRTGTIKQYML